MMVKHSFRTSDEVSKALTDRLLLAYEDRSDTDSPFVLAVSGGSTPKALFEYWKGFPELFTDKNICFVWVDERVVPYSSPDSNFGEAYRAFFKDLPLSEEKLIPINTDISPEEAAREYSEKILSIKKMYAKEKAIDFAILGMGDDGHTSSLFPGQEESYKIEQLFIPSIHPVNKIERVALSMYGILNETGVVAFHLLGEKKKTILESVLDDALLDGKGCQFPSSYVIVNRSNTEIFTDIQL